MAQSYDAFLSYSSSDRTTVRRVHRFLESYRDSALGRRLRVYFDQTDIRGGELSAELREALRASNSLIACYSPAAAESRWVAAEIKAFRQQHGDTRIAIALLNSSMPAPRFAELSDVDCRNHDLRRGWWWRWLRPHARLELLRLLAFVSNVELRRLRNWHLRRSVRNFAVAAGVAIGIPAAILSLPMPQWSALELKSGTQPLYPIAAEVQDNKLWVAWRIRAPGHLRGVRDQYYQSHDALNPHVIGGNTTSFRLQRRLLPANLVRHGVPSGLRNFNVGSVTSVQTRQRVGKPYLAALTGERALLLQPLSATEEEVAAQADARPDPSPSEEEGDAPERVKARPKQPRSSTALALTRTGRQVHAAEVPGLSIEWQPSEASGLLTSPAAGVALLWLDDGRIWLGAQGVDATANGGLWHSPDAGRSWRREPDLYSVSSIGVRVRSRERTLVVAETRFDRWDRAILRPYPSRVIERNLDAGGAWRAASMPPFGSRSQVELCGEVDGAEIVRVDEQVFRSGSVPLWRLLTADNPQEPMQWR